MRERAATLGLRTAHKAESQDVCFITRARGRSDFLSARTSLHPAEVVDTAGRAVGRVDAVELVTVGQRRGLELAGGHGRRYVVDVDVASARVTVGERSELFTAATELDDPSWNVDAGDPVRVLAQTSAHGESAPALVESLGGDRARLVWDRPHRRVAPGQSVVLYGDVTTVDGSTEQVVLAGATAA